MATARARHTATLLPDGRVIVVGAGDGRAAEIFDPATERWTTTRNMVEARTNHTATLLPDGTVLVAGGSGGQGLPVPSAELFDPTSHCWTATGTMREARANHTATLLRDGTVWAMGGAIDPDGEAVLATGELYDPRTGTAVVPDSTLYLPLQSSAGVVGGTLVAVERDGQVGPGWPVALKRRGAEFWSVVVGADGTVYALAIEPESGDGSSAGILAIAPDSTVLSVTTIIEP
jgi:hypothetical protein